MRFEIDFLFPFKFSFVSLRQIESYFLASMFERFNEFYTLELSKRIGTVLVTHSLIFNSSKKITFYSLVNIWDLNNIFIDKRNGALFYLGVLGRCLTPSSASASPM